MTSDYILEERIVASVWTHERPQTGNSMRQVQDDFQQRFRKEPPPKQTLLRWERKLFQTGSVKDKPRTGRPQSRRTQCEEIDNAISKTPKKSTRKQSAELGVPRTTSRRHVKVDLKLFPYRPMFVQELSDDDLNHRRDACGRILQEFRSGVKKTKSHFQC